MTTILIIFIIGVFVGGILGVTLAAMMSVSRGVSGREHKWRKGGEDE